jgi:exopolyphosphatase/guanosine-5'-triphosphate,3'-diphosphate pyrophosphatase
MQSTSLVRRAVIDMGSGTTKLLVAEVDSTLRVLRSSLYDEEREVFLAHDLSKQREKLKIAAGSSVPLSEEIQKDAIATVSSYVAIAKKYGVKREDITGFATAVFREASNATEVLQRIKKETGVSIAVISQQREGEVGFYTAKAMVPLVHPELSSMEDKNLCVWDSGGASFQLTMRKVLAGSSSSSSSSSSSAGEQKSEQQAEEACVDVYQGPLGSAKMHAALVQVRS